MANKRRIDKKASRCKKIFELSNGENRSQWEFVNQKGFDFAHDSNVNVVNLGSADSVGAVVAANLKYFRVTNLDDTNFISVIIYDSGAGHEIALKVEPGASFFFTTDDIYANDDSAVDFAGTLIAAEAIYLRADTAACDCEYICVTT